MLEYFNKLHNNRAHILISFWKGRKTKSKYYFIPVEVMETFMKKIPKKSANMKDFAEHLGLYDVKLEDLYKKFW